MRRIRHAYEKEIVHHRIGRQIAREIEEWEEPQDSNDSDYTEASQLPDLSVQRPRSERQLRLRGDNQE